MSDQTLLESILARCAMLLTTNVQLQRDLGAQVVNGVGPIQALQWQHKRIAHLQRHLSEHTLAPAHAVAEMQFLEQFAGSNETIIQQRRAGAEELAEWLGVMPEQALPLYVIDREIQYFQAQVTTFAPEQQPLVQAIVDQCRNVLDDLQRPDGTKTLGDLYMAWDAVKEAFNARFTFESNATVTAGYNDAESDIVRHDLRDLLAEMTILAQRLQTEQAPPALRSKCWAVLHEGHGILTVFAATDLLDIRDYLQRLQTTHAQGIAWLNPQPRG